MTEYNRKKAEKETARNTKRERIEELTRELHTLTNKGKVKEDQKKKLGNQKNNPVKKIHKNRKESNHPKNQNFKG